MKLTHRVLRAVAVVGVAAAAPLAAALPAQAGAMEKRPHDAAATAEAPPWEGAADFLPGPSATDVVPGPSIIAI
jgi:hypothetical protein